MSRFCLNPEAFFAFALKVTVLRKNTRESKVAGAFLQAINEHMLILVALMADAGSEALALIRSMDREDLVAVSYTHLTLPTN